MRTTQQNLELLNQEQAKHPELEKLNSPSRTAIFTMWKHMTAVIMNLIEQLIVKFKGEVSTSVAGAKIGSDEWLHNEILKFQYSATTPQVLTLVDFKPAYSEVNEDLQLITRCSVVTNANKNVSVKVAKSEPPVALSAPELTSLRNYIDNICFAGQQVQTYSYSPDLVYLKASIYYNGQYAEVIENTVIEAINEYFASVPFNGKLKASALEDYIQLVAGVTDIVIEDLAIRPNGSVFADTTHLIEAQTTIFPTYPTYAGYVIGETEPGETLTDRLTFIAQ